MNDNIKIIDNSRKIKKAMQDGVEAALEAIGNQAVSYAKHIITTESRVDTGNLRNSINHQVEMDEEAVYVGTNVEYAVYNEYGTGKYAGGTNKGWYYKDDSGNWHYTEGMKGIHMIRDSVSGHEKEYKSIAQDEIKKHLP
jgi:phage gpG-like protein